jgi:DNA-binding CsgD family transcriptional regulator
MSADAAPAKACVVVTCADRHLRERVLVAVAAAGHQACNATHAGSGHVRVLAGDPTPPQPYGAQPATVVITGDGDVLSHLEHGSRAVVALASLEKDLPLALAAAAWGGVYVSASLAAGLRSGLSRHEPAVRHLTARERQTLSLIGEGFTHGQVARRMAITEATVDTYVKRLRAKLGVANKAGLTRAAMELEHLRDLAP